MAIPDFLRFAPVPLRARRDGWTPLAQRRFVLALARGMGPAEAARSLGRSRQTAYALRRKPGAGPFAAAWDAAVDFAREMRSAPRPLGPACSGIETLLVPRFYRGRLIGFVQREDVAGAMRRLALLDRLAERLSVLDRPGPALDEALDTIAAACAKADEADAMVRANGARASSSAGLGLRHGRAEGLG